jgi:hypothetical protein
MQDKYPPGRIPVGAGEPRTASGPADIFPKSKNYHQSPATFGTPPADNRPKHHGSEKRKTEQIAARVRPAVKSEIARLAKLKGWTQSQVVAALVESGLAANLAEQFGVMLKATIQEAVTSQLKKDNSRTATLAVEAFFSAEQGRILTIYLLRTLLGENIELLPEIIKDSQEQALENMSFVVSEKNQQN